jgi:radical SAM superfamily enzyme YgiQ (UPF0313 family)
LRPLEKIWSAAVTIDVTDDVALVRAMALAGCTGVFIGFESLEEQNLSDARKRTPRAADYARRVRLLHDHGIAVNGSFVLGFDHDGPDVFERTVAWIEATRLECATFHILTPYPATPLFRQLEAENRLLHRDWDLYDTRHAVFRPAKLTAAELEYGYHRAYREFYRWKSIARGAAAHGDLIAGFRHFGYSAGWKKFEPLWDFVIRTRRAGAMLPVLEAILSEFGRRKPQRPGLTAETHRRQEFLQEDPNRAALVGRG